MAQVECLWIWTQRAPLVLGHWMLSKRQFNCQDQHQHKRLQQWHLAIRSNIKHQCRRLDSRSCTAWVTKCFLAGQVPSPLHMFEKEAIFQQARTSGHARSTGTHFVPATTPATIPATTPATDQSDDAAGQMVEVMREVPTCRICIKPEDVLLGPLVSHGVACNHSFHLHLVMDRKS